MSADGGGSIVLMGNSWNLESTVTVPANVSIEGTSRSCVVRPTADHNVFRINGSGASIGTMTIDGTGTTNAIGVRIELNSDNVTLSDMTITKMGLDGIYGAFNGTMASAPANLTLTNIDTSDCGRSNIAITSCDGATLTDVTSTNSAINGINFEHGPFRNVVVDGFAVDNAARHGINVNTEDAYDPAVNITIRNGTVANSGGVGIPGDDFSNDAGVRFRRSAAGCSVDNLAVSNGHTTTIVNQLSVIVPVTVTNSTYTP